MALHSLYYADVPLRNCSLTHSPIQSTFPLPLFCHSLAAMRQRVASRRQGGHLESITSYRKSVNRCLFIYLRNNPAKFHPDPIWNDGVTQDRWNPVGQYRFQRSRVLSSRFAGCVSAVRGSMSGTTNCPYTPSKTRRKHAGS